MKSNSILFTISKEETFVDVMENDKFFNKTISEIENNELYKQIIDSDLYKFVKEWIDKSVFYYSFDLFFDFTHETKVVSFGARTEEDESVPFFKQKGLTINELLNNMYSLLHTMKTSNCLFY